MISLLRQKIEILRKQSTPDEAGGIFSNYASLRSLWAEVKWRRSIGKNIGFRFVKQRRATVRFRAREEVFFTDRLRLRGRVYEITSIIEEAPNAHFIQLDIQEIIS